MVVLQYMQWSQKGGITAAILTPCSLLPKTSLSPEFDCLRQGRPGSEAKLNVTVFTLSHISQVTKLLLLQVCMQFSRKKRTVLHTMHTVEVTADHVIVI